MFVAWRDIGTFVRLCFGVSCGIARARSFVCDRGHACRARRGRGVAVATVAVVSRLSRRARRGRVRRGCGRRALDATPAVPWP